VLRWNKTGITVVGGLGNGNNQLNSPFDAVVDYANNLYVVDQANHRVQKYSFGSSSGETAAGNGTYGSSSNQLYYPSKLLIDSNENLYISDTYHHRIQFWRKVANAGITVAGTMGTINKLIYHLFVLEYEYYCVYFYRHFWKRNQSIVYSIWYCSSSNNKYTLYIRLW